MDMDTESKRQQVNLEQITALLEFLKEHQELAKGLARGRRGKFNTLKIWNQCAKKLNNVKHGANKDGKGWSKYWCDWKYRVRRRALELRAARENNRPIPEGTLALSSMEENILNLIGENAVEAVIIRSDPLDDGDTEMDEEDTNNLKNEVTLTQNATPRRRKRKRRKENAPKDSDLDCGGPSSPLEQKPRMTPSKNGDKDDSDNDDDVTQFLQLENKKLEHSTKMVDTLQSIQQQLTRLTDIMGDIRDCLEDRIKYV